MKLEKAIARLKKHGRNFRELKDKRGATIYTVDINGHTIGVFLSANPGEASNSLDIFPDGMASFSGMSLTVHVKRCQNNPGHGTFKGERLA